MLLAVVSFTSCSEEDDSVEEFPNWEAKNVAYFQNLKDSVKQLISEGRTDWKIYPIFSQDSDKVSTSSDSIIVVHVENAGTGSGCPLYTDTVRVHYLGKLLPSTSYSDGYIFDRSYYGDYDTTTNVPSKLAVSGTVDGFSTALMKMHIGDRWTVYMPYQMAYGTSGSGSIPGYSTLIFDMTLSAYYRVGTVVPDWK